MTKTLVVEAKGVSGSGPRGRYWTVKVKGYINEDGKRRPTSRLSATEFKELLEVSIRSNVFSLFGTFTGGFRSPYVVILGSLRREHGEVLKEVLARRFKSIFIQP